MDAPEVPAHTSSSHGDGKIMDALKHKYGPLPGYAWGGIAVVAIVLLAKLKGGSSAAAAQPGVNPLTLVPNGSGLDGGGGGGGGSTGDPFAGGTLIGTTIPDGSLDTTPSTPTTGALAVPTATPVAPPTIFSAPLPIARTQVLDVSSGGAVVGQVTAPVFPIGTPASVLYEAVGLHASDPYTLLPSGVAPETAAQHAEVLDGQAIKQAQATANKTHQAVAV